MAERTANHLEGTKMETGAFRRDPLQDVTYCSLPEQTPDSVHSDTVQDTFLCEYDSSLHSTDSESAPR